MEILSNLSCCFDSSKSIGEAGVELVICDCPVSKQCCLKWEAITYISAVAFSVADFLADVLGYVAFVSIMENPDMVRSYINAWLAFIIVSGIIVMSEVALPIYSMFRVIGCGDRKDETEEELESYRSIAKYWSRANNVLVIFTEDGVIAMIRILIAFRSVEAVQDLQTTTGVVTSAIAFVVTVLRHGLLMIQMITKFSRNEVTFSKRPPWPKGYCTKATLGLHLLFIFTLFLSSCSVGLTAMSMAISGQLFEVVYNDAADFFLNVTLVIVAVPAVFLLSGFIIIQTRW